jgi:hypothetical protein
MAMKGQYWNINTNSPTLELKTFLDEKALSIQRRIKESTGLVITKPIYYSALHNYNIASVIDHVIYHLPNERRKLRTFP